MSLDACAALVEKGDPDRWAAVLAAPIQARAILLPIYAANLEIARAPFAATEPMIAEMRVQWWVDALTEIAEGASVRAHEVTTPLADAITPDAARHLIRVAEARRRDCWNSAFADMGEFADYLSRTGGALMTAAAIATGETESAAYNELGTASALAAYLVARPELSARDRDLSRDLDTATLSSMAGTYLASTTRTKPRGAAALAAFKCRAILARAARDTSAIEEGRLEPSEFRARLALLRAAFLAR